MGRTKQTARSSYGQRSNTNPPQAFIKKKQEVKKNPTKKKELPPTKFFAELCFSLEGIKGKGKKVYSLKKTTNVPINIKDENQAVDFSNFIDSFLKENFEKFKDEALEGQLKVTGQLEDLGESVDLNVD